MQKQHVAIDIEQCGLDVVVLVFEEEVITTLDEAKFEVVRYLDDIAISDGESLDGVFVHGEFKDVRSIPSDQDVDAPSTMEGVVAFAATKGVVAVVSAEEIAALASFDQVMPGMAAENVVALSSM